MAGGPLTVIEVDILQLVRLDISNTSTSRDVGLRVATLQLSS